jgi:hypothetical protein
VPGRLSARGLGLWPSPAVKVAYAAHTAGMVGVPLAGHRTRCTRGGMAANGGLGDKVSLGRWYEHERRTMNLPDTEKTVKSHRGQLLTVRRAEEATAMAFRRWGWLRRSKAVVKAPAALEAAWMELTEGGA